MKQYKKCKLYFDQDQKNLELLLNPCRRLSVLFFVCVSSVANHLRDSVRAGSKRTNRTRTDDGKTTHEPRTDYPRTDRPRTDRRTGRPCKTQQHGPEKRKARETQQQPEERQRRAKPKSGGTTIAKPKSGVYLLVVIFGAE